MMMNMPNSKKSKNKAMNDKFREWFIKPPFTVRKPILHPLISNNPALVGTAFDYLLRFKIQYMTPNAVFHPWIAEEGLKVVSHRLKAKNYTSESEKKDLKAWLKEGTKLLDRAKENHAKYLKDGIITTELIESSIHLAKMDVFYRSPENIEGRIQEIDTLDVEDLRELINGVKEDQFKTKELCILNPRFTNAARITGVKTDADLLLDDTLIDIKTFKNLRFDREIFNQIMGYYLLSKIGGIDNAPEDYKIQKVGVYYPRHEYLHIFDIESTIRIKMRLCEKY